MCVNLVGGKLGKLIVEHEGLFALGAEQLLKIGINIEK
jgi:hypothetical protein